jgi:hypothetical protein
MASAHDSAFELAYLAARLLRFEQRLEAYQRLHANELAELWRGLNECKRQIVDTLSEQESEPIHELGEDISPTNPL